MDSTVIGSNSPTSARPDHGGRVELKLTRASEAGAVYRAEWSTPAGKWHGTVTASDRHAEARPDDSPTPPPDWLVAWSAALLKTTGRTVMRMPDARWPRRLTRWRAAPEERP